MQVLVVLVAEIGGNLIYQLPSGKIISLSIEQYLDLTEDDIDYLISINFGEYAHSPWHGSAIKNKIKEPEEDIDTSIDYSEDPDEVITKAMPNIVLLDDLEDFSDVDFSDIEE